MGEPARVVCVRASSGEVIFARCGIWLQTVDEMTPAVGFEAFYGLSFQPPSQKAIAALQAVVEVWQTRQPLSKTQRCLLNNARFSLKRQRQSCQRL